MVVYPLASEDLPRAFPGDLARLCFFLLRNKAAVWSSPFQLCSESTPHPGGIYVVQDQRDEQWLLLTATTCGLDFRDPL